MAALGCWDAIVPSREGQRAKPQDGVPMGDTAKNVKVGASQPKEVGESKKEILVGRKERTSHKRGLQRS